MPRYLRPFIVALAFLSANAPRSLSDVIRRTLAPGVEYSQETLAPPTGPLLINVLRVNLKAPGVKIRAQLGKDVVLTDDPTLGREAVGLLAARHGAMAAVNADFFPYTGDPLNITIRDGELLSESMPHRVSMAITGSGQIRFDNLLTVGSLMGTDGSVYGLDGINRLAGANEIVVLTPAFGSRSWAATMAAMVTVNAVNLPVCVGQDQTGTAGDVLPGDPKAAVPNGGALLVGSGRGADWLRAHVRSGDTVRFRFDCLSNPLPTGPYRKELASRAGSAASFRGRALKSVWTDVQQAVGGGPWLVRDGHAAIDSREENWDENNFVQARHPRTAAGVTAAGELLLVTVDGRQAALSRGMSLPELADYMVKLGAVNAINLDGGGSTSMAIRGAYVNSPSDGYPRPVATSLLVFADSPVLNSAAFADSLEPITFRADEHVAVPFPNLPAAANGTPANAEGVWGSVEGKGFISQKGILTSTNAGPGTAVFSVGDRTVRIPYVVLPGPPAKIRGSLGAVANNPPDRNMLSAVVMDAYGNAIPGQPIHVQVIGGNADKTDLVTDAGGRIAVELVWDVEKGRKVLVTSGPLGPVTVNGK